MTEYKYLLVIYPHCRIRRSPPSRNRNRNFRSRFLAARLSVQGALLAPRVSASILVQSLLLLRSYCQLLVLLHAGFPTAAHNHHNHHHHDHDYDDHDDNEDDDFCYYYYYHYYYYDDYYYYYYHYRYRYRYRCSCPWPCRSATLLLNYHTTSTTCCRCYYN